MSNRVGRTEYYTKDGIYVSYTDNDVCFEEVNTADSILIKNDGSILFNNFSGDKAKTLFFVNWFNSIYPTVMHLRTLERLGEI